MKIKVKTNCEKEIELKKGMKFMLDGCNSSYTIYDVVDKGIIVYLGYSGYYSNLIYFPPDYLTEHNIQIIEEPTNSEEGEEKRWMPLVGDKYWFLDDRGDIVQCEWVNDYFDIWRYTSHDCFPTVEEAQAYKDNLLKEAEE